MIDMLAAAAAAGGTADRWQRSSLGERSLRLVYLDPGLLKNLGHHANSCRQITRAAKSRGMQWRVLAHSNLEGTLKDELGALPFFRWGTYATPTAKTDKIAGWLRDFELGTRTTVADLNRLTGFEAGDIVYVNSAQAVQFAATLRWLNELPAASRPSVVLEFGIDPGVTTSILEGKRIYRPADTRAILYRYASYAWPEQGEPLPLHCVTFDAGSSAAYAELIRRPVATVPLPRLAITDRRPRRGADPITIGVLGHQRLDKGYQLMPDTVQAVLQQRERVRFLLHNAAPDQMPLVQEKLRELAAGDARVVLDERVADEAIWASLLSACDLILCPYDPNRFRTSYSGVQSEAIAEGIPTVIPAESSLSELADSFGSPCTVFADWTAPSIAAAVVEAFDRFDELARRAEIGARGWPQANGPDHFLDTVLRLAREKAPDVMQID